MQSGTAWGQPLSRHVKSRAAEGRSDSTTRSGMRQMQVLNHALVLDLDHILVDSICNWLFCKLAVSTKFMFNSRATALIQAFMDCLVHLPKTQRRCNSRCN